LPAVYACVAATCRHPRSADCKQGENRVVGLWDRPRMSRPHHRRAGGGRSDRFRRGRGPRSRPAFTICAETPAVGRRLRDRRGDRLASDPAWWSNLGPNRKDVRDGDGGRGGRGAER
jgi:hypothetical protein